MIAACALFVALGAPIDISKLYCDFWPCPQVYQIHGVGSNSYGESLDILFVPDGFTNTELPLFRCSAQLLLDGLLASEPYASYLGCNVNAYRIDLVAGQSGIGRAPECTAAPEDCLAGPADWTGMDAICSGIDDATLAGTPIWPNDFCPTKLDSFETSVCRRDICRVAWPDTQGVMDAIDLAVGCVPSVDRVVIIANSQQKGGGGAPGAPGLVVVTTDNIKAATRWRRLAHEMGHTFGLLDEYTKAGVEAAYSCRRNVYSPLATLSCTDQLEWESECHPTPASALAPPCPTSSKCTTICHGSPCACSCGSPTSPVVGLFEGAFSSICSYYRSENECRMNDYADEFCGVCGGYMRRVASDGDVYPCIEVPPHRYALDRVRPPDIWQLAGRGPVTSPPRWPLDLALAGGATEPVLGMWAAVERDGIRGEVPIREIRVEMREPGRAGSSASGAHRLVIRKVRDAGVDRLEWTLDGRPLRPEARDRETARRGGTERADPIPFGVVLGEIVVEDEMDLTWNARGVRWQTSGAGR